MAIVGFRQLSLCVRDLERSCRFYAEVLGFEPGAVRPVEGSAVARSLGLASARGRSVVLVRSELTIELLQLDNPPVAETSWIPHHLVFSVDDLEATLQSLRDRGVELLEATRVVIAPGVASCLVCDPDGLRIELYQEPTPV